ncbi:MAG: hypothetical protein H6Q16_1438 [Bacteroidetes bacterium]|nr:hypothetical protein [Bacteroidota bacterium]
MKKSILILLAIVFAINLNSKAEDFSAINDGDTIYYKIISSTSPYTVAVIFKGDYNESYDNEYSGSIVIPDSVFYNGNYYNVTSIGDTAFFDCNGLTSITIPNSVITIGNNAFAYCNELTSIIIPNSVTSIGSNVFRECIALTSISIPNSVNSIGDYAFYGCSNLGSITIPNSVTLIGGKAFHNTSYYNNMPIGLVYINNVLYSYKGTMPANTSINIQSGTISIAGNAFENCSGLTSISISNSVTSIGEYAFFSCSGLTSITIPNSITRIAGRTFFNCSGLTSVIIPNSVTSIGESAFFDCNGLTSITIGSSVDSIGGGAFWNCTGLTSINSLAINPPIIKSSSFFGVNRAIPVFIPCNTISSYQSASYWSTFTNYIEKTLHFIDTSICQGSTYAGFGVILDSSGVYSFVSGCDSIILTLNVNPIPNIPLNLNAQIMSDYIELTWQDDSCTYIIYRNDDSLTTTTTPMYLDYDVIKGQSYCYRLKSISSDCESEFSDTICKTYLGLEEISFSNISTNIYPNPTAGKTRLEVEGLTSEADVLVYDMVGRLIQKHKINQGTKELDIDLSENAKGVYSIRIVNESINQTKKLIVQ